MAKENYVSLRGQLRREVGFKYNPQTGEPMGAMFALTTIRRDIYDRAGQVDPNFQRPIMMVNDPLLLQDVMELEVGDLVEVKGVIQTGHSKRTRICPHCGQPNVVTVPVQVIVPIYIGKLKHCANDADGLRELAKCAEISNIGKVIGRVCTPTEQIAVGNSKTGHFFTKYKVAVNRKFYLPGSVGSEDHADYISVISYDETAQDDQAVLRQGSLIYIDGYVHTMLLKEESTCEHCGETFTVRNQHAVLTPYSNEYLRDYDEDALEATHGAEDEAI